MANAVVKSSCTVNDVILFKSLTLLSDKPVGSGAFSAVFKALHNDWGCLVAYKKLAVHFIEDGSITNERLIHSLKNEAEMHRQLRHPNVVSMLGVIFEPYNYGMVLEYVAYSSWSAFLDFVVQAPEMSCISWRLKSKLVQEISSGMAYLHSLEIIHCDLKVQNVLIGEQFTAKISDFGLSKWKHFSRSHSSVGTIRGTFSHIAPEKWLDINHPENEKSDIYSFGILVWEMFTEKQPFANSDAMIRDWVISGKRLPLDWIPRVVPTEIHEVIQVCWTQQAAERPSFSMLALKLRSLVDISTTEEEINADKAVVLIAYCKGASRSISIGNSDDSMRSLQLDNHCQKIKRVHQVICEFIRRTDTILSSLFQRGAVTSREQAMIRAESTIFQWADRLLDLLCAKPVSAYNCFLEALDASNQHHLHCLLEEKDYKMNIDHQQRLIYNFTYLKANITLSDSLLIDTLLSCDVLDQLEVAEIRSKSTDHEKTDIFLQFILRTSEEQYVQFLESLAKCNHEHVYVVLQESLNSCPQLPQVSTDERESKLDAQSFLDGPTLLGVVSANGQIIGLTVLNDELFVLLWRSTQVNVYSTKDFTITRYVTLTGSSYLRAIVASSQFNCLYISDTHLKVVHRYNLSDDVITKWSVNDTCYGLSLTSTGNLLVTLCDTRRIREYSPDGSLMIREIILDSSIEDPWHSVQLSGDQIVVSHDKVGSLHRVCIINRSGQIIQSYSGSVGSDIGQVHDQTYMVVDGNDNVLVADPYNDRVILLTPSLTNTGNVTVPGHQLNGPYALHLDQLNRRLYIGEGISTGRVFVLHVDLS